MVAHTRSGGTWVAAVDRAVRHLYAEFASGTRSYNHLRTRMGVEHLRKALSSCTVQCNLRLLLHGRILGLDASVWLHRMAATAAADVLQGRYEKVISRFLEELHLFILGGCTPLIVFDGRERYPPKSRVDRERDADRSAAQARAIQDGKIVGTSKDVQSAVKITQNLVQQLIVKLVEQKISYIVAPREADAQLALLDREGITDLTMTSDQDAIVHGIRRIIYAWDLKAGTCQVFSYARIASNPPAGGDAVLATLLYKRSSLHIACMLRCYAVLAGCDYMKISGVGPHLAAAALRAVVPGDVEVTSVDATLELVAHVLSSERGGSLIMNDVSVAESQVALELKKAAAAFRHAPAFSFLSQRCKTLSGYEPGAVSAVIADYLGLGSVLSMEPAKQISDALGDNLVGDDVAVICGAAAGIGSAPRKLNVNRVGDAYVDYTVPAMVEGGDLRHTAGKESEIEKLQRDALVRFLQVRRAQGVTAKTKPVLIKMVVAHMRIEAITLDMEVMVDGDDADEAAHGRERMPQPSVQAVATKPVAAKTGRAQASVIARSSSTPLPSAAETETVRQETDSGFCSQPTLAAHNQLHAPVQPSGPGASQDALPCDTGPALPPWQFISYQDNATIICRDFPGVSDQVLQTVFAKREFHEKMKPLRKGEAVARHVGALPPFMWARPQGAPVPGSEEIHWVSIICPASYMHTQYLVEAKLSVLNPPEAAAMPPAMSNAPFVKGVLHAYCGPDRSRTSEKDTKYCVAGKSGRCWHVAFLLYVLQFLPRTSDSKIVRSPTSQLCRWVQPKAAWTLEMKKDVPLSSLVRQAVRSGRPDSTRQWFSNADVAAVGGRMAWRSRTSAPAGSSPPVDAAARAAHASAMRQLETAMQEVRPTATIPAFAVWWREPVEEPARGVGGSLPTASATPSEPDTAVPQSISLGGTETPVNEASQAIAAIPTLAPAAAGVKRRRPAVPEHETRKRRNEATISGDGSQQKGPRRPFSQKHPRVVMPNPLTAPHPTPDDPMRPFVCSVHGWLSEVGAARHFTATVAIAGSTAPHTCSFLGTPEGESWLREWRAKASQRVPRRPLIRLPNAGESFDTANPHRPKQRRATAASAGAV